MINPSLLINGLSCWPDLAVCVLWGLYWPHSSIFSVRNRSKHLTLSGLQGILAMKMTHVDDFEQFFDLEWPAVGSDRCFAGSKRAFLAVRTSSAKFGRQNRSKNVQKIC
jgi:hypothetical protein